VNFMKWSVVLIVSLILFLEMRSESGLAEQTGWNTFGPTGGTVSVLAIDPVNPNTLYSSNSGALFKSKDKGANWRVLNVAPGGVDELVIDPHDSRNIYASSGWEVFKSTDGGMSWTVLHMSSSPQDIG